MCSTSYPQFSTRDIKKQQRIFISEDANGWGAMQSGRKKKQQHIIVVAAWREIYERYEGVTMSVISFANS